MRPCKEGESTVPGQIALQRTPRATKSTAIDLVRPMTAALLAPYAKRFGTPVTLDATDDMLTIDPRPRSSIPGRKARIIWNMAVTFTANARAQSATGRAG